MAVCAAARQRGGLINGLRHKASVLECRAPTLLDNERLALLGACISDRLQESGGGRCVSLAAGSWTGRIDCVAMMIYLCIEVGEMARPGLEQ